MVALLIENSKLIMIFLLIGTIIGLAYFGNRPLGDEDRQAPWNEEGDRGTGPPIGRRHAPHLG
jgi:hypothetical protein